MMTAASAGSRSGGGESLWPRLAELPLVVEACEYDRLHAVAAYGFDRVTTHVRLAGAGADGLGEDASVFNEDGTTLHETRPALPLHGEWTLAGFCAHLAALDLWPQPPEWDGLVRLRTWAFAAAALDLALRQAGRPLHDALGLEPRPVRFVNSLGLGEVPSIEPLRRRLARSPGVRFKLDAEADLDAGARRRDRRNRRGRHDRLQGPVRPGGQGSRGARRPVRPRAGGVSDTRIWRIRTTCPGSRSGSASTSSGCRTTRRSEAPRTSARRRLGARVVNVKPGRIGGLRELFEVYARCERERRPMYGGGFGELGVGRGQIQLLAALFHADAPNDVAPSAYNEDDPPGSLPGSPLPPRPAATGFRWAT